MIRYLIVASLLASEAFASGQVVLNFTWNETRPPTALCAAADNEFFATLGPEVAKFDSTGRRDPTFHSGLTQAELLYPSILALDADGGLFVAPYALVGNVLYGLVKLRPNGDINSSFKPISITGASQTAAGAISSIAIDGKGGIYIGGTFTSVNGVKAVSLAHVDAGGIVAPLFVDRLAGNGPIFLARINTGLLVVCETDAFVISDDGSIRDLELPLRGQWRDTAPGAADPRFGVALPLTYLRNGAAEDVLAVWDYNGRLNRTFASNLVFGPTPLTNLHWDQKGRLVGINGRVASEAGPITDDGTLGGPKRVLQDGTLDPTWSRTLGLNGLQTSICVLDNGDYIVGGLFTKVAGVDESGATRIASDNDNAANHAEMSARGSISPQHPLILGLIVPQSDLSVDVLIRAPSTSLQRFGVQPTSPSTRFSVYRGQQLIGAFTQFNTAANAQFVASVVGAFPLSDTHTEAQTLLSLEPGAYTVVIDGDNGNQGEVLGEIYYPR